MTKKDLGAKRYRMRRRILDHLEFQGGGGVSLPEIAEHLGVTVEAVRKTLNGEAHSARILQALRDAGVPEELLFDPRKYGLKMRGSGYPRKHLEAV